MAAMLLVMIGCLNFAHYGMRVSVVQATHWEHCPQGRQWYDECRRFAAENRQLQLPVAMLF
jgi:hypothetical protein